MELVKKEDNLITTISDIESQKKMCEMLVKTPHYAKIGAEGIYAITAKARSLGMDPIDALNGGLYYVNGRVGMSTESMAARMRSYGHSIQKDPKSTSTCCILNGKRADNGDTWQVSFSVEDAKRAGIYKEGGPWGKYPSVMCYNRAMSMMFRQLTPDLSNGVGYTLEELKEIPESKYETIEPIRELISDQQAEELRNVFNDCNPDYIEKVWQTLRKPPISIETLNQLPLSLFDRIHSAALKNRNEYQTSLSDTIALKTEDIALEA